MEPLVHFDDSGTPQFLNTSHPAQDLIQSWLGGDTSFNVNTSGSTGPPKTIRHTRKAMQASARQTGKALRFQQGDNMHIVIPVTRIGGMMQLIRALEYRMNIYIYEPHIAVLNNIYISPGRHHISLTPPMLIGKEIPAHLTTILVGGAGVGNSLIESVANFQGKIYETYGMTETCSNLALRDLKGQNKRFVPLPDWRLRVGADGVLNIQHELITENELYTGDLVELFSDGTFIYQGRIDHIINSGSRKYIPESIEQYIFSETSVELYISSVPDEIFGDFPVIMLTHAPDPAFAAWLKESQYAQVLRNYILISEWPMTIGGKLDRSVLKVLAKEAFLSNHMKPF